MKKLILNALIIGVTVLNLASCSDDDSVTPTGGNNADINTFVWKGLNQWYYWQSNVPNLADNIKSTDTYKNLIQNNTPENLFKNLLYQRGTADRNSIIMSDYTVLENLFSGVSLSSGFEYGSVEIPGTNNLILLVIYVESNTSVALAGVKRGDIITAINNTDITRDNMSTLMSNTTLSLTMATMDGNNNFIYKGTVTVQNSERQENPVLLSKVFEKNGKKVGYLVYNGFITEFNDELNAVFADFKTQGINDLVLDLRYNGGGDVETSSYLGSMITGQYNGSVYSELRTNAKIGEVYTYPLTNQMKVYNSSGQIGTEAINQLNLNRLFVIGTGNTASASELVINGLRGLGVEVVLVGTKTYGKDVASITLYDSESFYKVNVNPDHKYAMQPIVAKNYNGKGESNYSNGFEPQVAAADFPNGLRDIYQLGDVNEPMLNAALQYIDPAFISAKRKTASKSVPFNMVLFSKDLKNPFNKDMVIHPLQ
ncbi:MAG: S41 family peptidase [Flavobacteriales bacterium]